MSTLSEEDHLDPNNPKYYAPRRMRDEANAELPASTDAMRSMSSPASVDILLKQAISRSFRTLDPVAMHEPPAYGPVQWRELIPAAGRLAAAVGLATLAALFLVIMIPAAKNQTQDSTQGGNAPSIAEAPKAAPNMPNISSEKQAPREEESAPAPAEFGTILAATRTDQPTGPTMTHEQSEALLEQFVRWRQKLDSTDAPPQ
jgi:hypothetical protein